MKFLLAPELPLNRHRLRKLKEKAHYEQASDVSDDLDVKGKSSLHDQDNRVNIEKRSNGKQQLRSKLNVDQLCFG